MLNHISCLRLIVIALLVWSVLSIGDIAAQEVTETPTPDGIQGSIFANDTCAPPCWFGLIPGESTSAEVLEFLATSAQVAGLAIYQNGKWIRVDSETPWIADGKYNFEFGPFERENCCTGSSRAYIREGLLDSVDIVAREHITMDEVIMRLDWPDEIRLSRFAYTGTEFADFTIEFIYYDLYLSVGLATDVVLSTPRMCHFPSLRGNYWVGGVTYYSHRRATELVDVFVPNEESQQQPALLRYDLEQRHVPREMWETLIGDEPTTCQELWETLPEERIIPELWNKETEEDESP